MKQRKDIFILSIEYFINLLIVVPVCICLKHIKYNHSYRYKIRPSL